MTEALTSLDEYLHTLNRIVTEIRRTGAIIIFATTTPVAPGSVGRSNEEIDAYNRAAIGMMTKKHVEVNDLNSIVKQDLAGNLCADTVHLSEQGYHNGAQEVVKHIKRHL